MKLWRRCICMSIALCVFVSHSAYAHNPLFPEADVLIDVGHGGIDSGTLYDKHLEKELNLAISKKLYKLLRKKHIRVAMNRLGDYALSDENRWSSGGRHKRDLAQRSGLANELKPKIMLSIHINWANKPDKRGPVVLYQNQSDSILLAHLLQQSLNRLYDSAEPPRLGRTYYVLRHSECPTVIVEVGFMSNKKDRKLLSEAHGQKRIAEAVSIAVEQYFAMIHPEEKKEKSSSSRRK